ncbi:hypothetical protein RUM43_001192, partial [Polyplax serrata]
IHHDIFYCLEHPSLGFKLGDGRAKSKIFFAVKRSAMCIIENSIGKKKRKRRAKTSLIMNEEIKYEYERKKYVGPNYREGKANSE